MPQHPRNNRPNFRHRKTLSLVSLYSHHQSPLALDHSPDQCNFSAQRKMVAAQHACLMRSADRDRRASVQGCSCLGLRSYLCGGRRRVGGHRERPGILFSTLFLQSRRPV
jgi:hypothetical protein